LRVLSYRYNIVIITFSVYRTKEMTERVDYRTKENATSNLFAM
jgi:hypothetical protein